MTATLVGENPGRSAREDEMGNRYYTRTWQVSTDDARDGAREVASVLPVVRGSYYEVGSVGDAWYEADTFAYVRELVVEQNKEDPTDWICRAEYGPITPGRFDNPGSLNPIQDAPTVEWDAEERQEIVDEDINGDAIVNSAGDRFDPPVTRDDSRSVLVIERNVAEYNEAVAADYRNTLNSGVFYGFAAGTVLLKRIAARLQYNTLIGQYYRVRYEFHINTNGWKAEPLNAGMRQLNGAGTAYEAILVDGLPVSEPVPLDADGVAVAAGGTPVFLEFDIYESRDFDALGLE